MSYSSPKEPSYTATEQGQSFRAGAQDNSPPWLRGPVGARYIYSQSIQLDALAEKTRWGILQRFPEYAQPEALAPLGRDRKIFRGLSEPDENYARRLRQFKPTWKLAGNAPTLLKQLWEIQRPNVTRIRYVCNGYTSETATLGNQFADWWTVEGDPVTGDPVLTFERVSPSNWNWDNAAGYNIRFWIIVYREDFIPAKWGVPPYPWGEPGLRWGVQPPGDTSWIADTYNAVSVFKAAGSHMGPWPTLNGGLIIANPTETASPWGAEGPFSPSYAPGYPMPDGTFATVSARPVNGAVYLSGI